MEAEPKLYRVKQEYPGGLYFCFLVSYLSFSEHLLLNILFSKLKNAFLGIISKTFWTLIFAVQFLQLPNVQFLQLPNVPLYAFIVRVFITRLIHNHLVLFHSTSFLMI